MVLPRLFSARNRLRARPVPKPLDAGHGEVHIQQRRDPLVLHDERGQTQTIADQPEPVAAPVAALDEFITHDREGCEGDVQGGDDLDISAPVPMRALLNRRGRNQALVRADPVVRNGITPSASQQAAGAMAEGLNNVGTNLLNKNLSIQPTLNIRPGYAFNVLVNRTMILPPYSGR
jgi:hypothetical protein